MFEPVDASHIADAVEKILGSEENLNSEYISLYQVVSIYQKVIEERNTLKEKLEARINIKLQSVDKIYSATIHEFDYEALTFFITVYNENSDHKIKFHFSKDKSGIYILKKEGTNKRFKDILSWLREEMNEWYDYCYELKEVVTQKSWQCQTLNSEFFVNIAYELTCVYYGEKFSASKFMLISCYDNDEYYSKCKLVEINELMRGKEHKFAKNIFIKISECPLWIQQQLYDIREEQLEKNVKKHKVDSKTQTVLEKKHRILKKIFPFIKW